MAVAYTKEQIDAVKQMIDVAGNFADQLYHIMTNHGLDLVEGCSLSISIVPEFAFTTRNISFGCTDKPAGHINVAKGKLDSEFTPFGENSPEYESTFAPKEIAEKMEEKPLPEDGLWV